MRPAFLPSSPVQPTTVHDVATCRRERSEARLVGVWIGAIIATAISLGVGILASRWQESTFDSQMRVVQAQHRAEIDYERKRVARYAEIDALATAMDQAAPRSGE